MSAMDLPELLILRHGETAWNAEGRLQGRLDSPLTALGAAQARDQRRILAARDLTGWHLRVSPQGRAQATARIVLEGLDLAPVTDPRLCEIDIGDWSGRTLDEIRTGWGWLFETEDPFDWYDHAPGGEGLAGLEARCRLVLADLERPSVLICHGITSRMLRILALGLRAEGLGSVPGGQGVAHHLSRGQAAVLWPPGAGRAGVSGAQRAAGD